MTKDHKKPGKKQSILVTGATSGIGNQFVKDYLLDDYRVYAVGRDDEALAQLKSLGADSRFRPYAARGGN